LFIALYLQLILKYKYLRRNASPIDRIARTGKPVFLSKQEYGENVMRFSIRQACVLAKFSSVFWLAPLRPR
jgi:hypothetical protein